MVMMMLQMAASLEKYNTSPLVVIAQGVPQVAVLCAQVIHSRVIRLIQHDQLVLRVVDREVVHRQAGVGVVRGDEVGPCVAQIGGQGLFL